MQLLKKSWLTANGQPGSLARLRERVGVRVLRAAWFSSLGAANPTARGSLTLALARLRERGPEPHRRRFLRN